MRSLVCKPMFANNIVYIHTTLIYGLVSRLQSHATHLTHHYNSIQRSPEHDPVFSYGLQAWGSISMQQETVHALPLSILVYKRMATSCPLGHKQCQWIKYRWPTAYLHHSSHSPINAISADQGWTESLRPNQNLTFAHGWTLSSEAGRLLCCIPL